MNRIALHQIESEFECTMTKAKHGANERERERRKGCVRTQITVYLFNIFKQYFRMHTQVQGKMLGKMSITCIMYTYIHSIITTIGTDWNNRIKIINMYKESTEPGKNQGENVYDDVRFIKQRWRRNTHEKNNNETIQQFNSSLSLSLSCSLRIILKNSHKN